MEAQGGAEVRRVHIVYFLSRKGRIEHPHLIRVHHLSRNGVRLRDVKRWLGELRGKEIPDSFSWSYKRSYKTGYVWQDLLDDDLITPISDNEYVLKGSEIFSTNIKEYSKLGKKRDQPSLQEEEHNNKASCKEENQSLPSEVHVSTKSQSEIEEESPSFGSETSTLSDESGRAEVGKSSDTTKQEKPTLLSKKSKKKSKNVLIDDAKTSSISAKGETEVEAALLSSKKSTSDPQCTKSKNNGNSASKMLRNLITCGEVQTNDSAVLPIKKQSKPLLSMCSTDTQHVNSSALCKRDSFGGSQRVFGNPSWTQKYFSGRKSFDGIEELRKNRSKSAEQKASSSAYKPVNGPNCAQCGKLFMPEKMHAHMKSCKGLKALSKCAADKASKATTFSGHLITH